MAEPIKGSLDKIVTSCQWRVMAITGLPEARVVIADPDDQDDIPQMGESLCCLWPGDASVNDYDAIGRYYTRESVVLQVGLFTRLAVDSKPSSRQWSSAAARGHLILRHKIYDALAGFYPVDNDANWLTEKALKPLGGPRQKRDRKTPGWGESRLRFEILYTLNLNLDYT